MRRSEREVKEENKILEIMDICKVCRLGMYDDGDIYILPMNYGYEYTDGKMTLYFHGSKAGRKIDILMKNGSVGFEMDCNHGLIEADTACKHSYRYASIIGSGMADVIEDNFEKLKGLNIIMKHQTGKEFEINEKMVNATAVIRVHVDEYSCKAHI